MSKIKWELTPLQTLFLFVMYGIAFWLFAYFMTHKSAALPLGWYFV